MLPFSFLTVNFLDYAGTLSCLGGLRGGRGAAPGRAESVARRMLPGTYERDRVQGEPEER